MERKLCDYRHFKGDLYTVVTLGNHSETREPMVIYRSKATGEVWVRPLAMWFDWVQYPDGTKGPRFVEVVEIFEDKV